ncbi:MAG: AAA family ATPase [Nitrospirae bacterium]|nr:AAA family ATPase [Magnetococcales bacterium]
MTLEELREKIKANLANKGITSPDIRLQIDPYKGWKLAVIANEFEHISARERKLTVLAGIDEHFEWLDLVTSAEKEWAGPLPGDEEPSQLPLWPEALARGNTGNASPVFSTDLDEDLTKPIVVTFYSLRGGVGRSTALAHTGRILSEMGHKVVCVDMDLEAPGLSSLFGVEDETIADLGVVSLLTALDNKQKIEFREHLIPVPRSDNLFLVPAGVPSAEYARKLRFVAPEMWYMEDYNPLRGLLDGLKKKLPFQPDVILLDARTGFSEMSGPLLFELADMAVVVFFPHPQAKSGTEVITRGLLSSKVKRDENGLHLTPMLRFLISPIPNTNTPGSIKQYRDRPLEWINNWMSAVNTLREKAGDEPFYPEEMAHFVPYSDAIATSDTVEYNSVKPSHYSQLAEWIVQLIPEDSVSGKPSPTTLSKNEILKDLRFSTGIAESQENLLDQFIQTELVKQALASETALVLGRKGTGKTALFRKISESDKDTTTALHAPMGLTVRKPWMMNVDGFMEVDKLIKSNKDIQWYHFWCYYTLVAIGWQLENQARNTVGVLSIDQIKPKTISEFLDMFESISKRPRFGLTLSDALTDFDLSLSTPRILALDGLDTGFGSSDLERTRRQYAIEGLFTFWAETSPRLKNISFKIFLREDIWKQVRLQNKSHLLGRMVTLKWKDQASYLKVALRQAMESTTFKSFLKGNLTNPSLIDQDINHWSTQEVTAVWNQLVGERMKGGNTTFSRNWVWNRLSDANRDHSPRFLLQLLYHALSWELSEDAKTPYTRSIIRPRAMIVCLEKVSQESLSSIEEEFQELEPLITKLKQIQRSPFHPLEVGEVTQHLDLAKEVGLLEVFEEDADGISKFKVPDFYRLALGIARKGQL